MAGAAYLLCLLTALACAVLLTRAHTRTREPLLVWSAACFWGLSIANALTIVDVWLVPQQDFYWARLVAGLGAVSVLLYGLIWETR